MVEDVLGIWYTESSSQSVSDRVESNVEMPSKSSVATKKNMFETISLLLCHLHFEHVHTMTSSFPYTNENVTMAGSSATFRPRNTS